MSATAKMWVSALANFFLAAGATLSGAMAQQGAVVWPEGPVYLLAGLAGLAAFWGNVKTYLATPPPK